MRTTAVWRVLSYMACLTVLAGCVRAQSAPGASASTSYDPAYIFGYDKNLPLLPEEQPTETTNDRTVSKVSFYSINDQRVPALLVLPVVKEGKRVPCILLMHGLGMNKSSLILLWSYFTKAGYGLLSIDAQYHGDRKSKTPLDLFGTSVFSTRDMLVQTVVDLRRAIDYLQTRKEIDPDRIGYVGFSMGGILGTLLAGVDSRVKAPILALAGGNWRLMAEHSMLPNVVVARQHASAQVLEQMAALDQIDPIRWVGRISPRPVLFINGDADTIVPVVSAQALKDAAGPGKEIFMYKGDHVPKGAEMTRVVDKIISWLDVHLKGSVVGSTR